jgi:anthranilate phosphoribosyltransferase
VILNAAGGVVAYRAAKSTVSASLVEQFNSAIELVTKSLDSGAAESKLADWVVATQS